MQAQTIVLLILAFLVALGLTIFQYYKKEVHKTLAYVLGILRFTAIFLGLLLLINPKLTRVEYTLEKANLILLFDNTTSIKNLEADGQTIDILGQIHQNGGLQEKFNILTYAFSGVINPLDSLNFEGKTTDISNSLKTIRETFAAQNTVVILISDGNQTFGEEYEFLRLPEKFQLHAVAVGDTTMYQDLRIAQLNSNRYAFLDNQFPLETRVLYSGNSTVEANFNVFMEGRSVYSETLGFSKSNRSKTINVLLKATTTGPKKVSVRIGQLENEKNTINNAKEQFVEIIDEKTKVGLVSSFKHPDLGALKKSIESNEQREVLFLYPDAGEEVLDDIDVFILYQPNASFAPIYNFIDARGGGSFTITGPKTDWSFLNRVITGFSKEDFGQTEEILSNKNEGFSLFDNSNFNMEDFPPLYGGLGELEFMIDFEVIAHQRIKGVDLETPLFFISGDADKKVYLLGENIWKWRLQSYRMTKNFQDFDTFMAKLIFFLSNSKKRERLQLDYENSYENAIDAVISATFFSKTYDFDPNANLNLVIRGAENGMERQIPMLLKGNRFQADLSDLGQGEYTFTVTETSERISKSGRFTILDFNVEAQFLSANDEKLERLAQSNSGKLYYPSQTEGLFSELSSDTSLVPIQKSTKNVVSLIDFRIVLAIMALSLALEWIIRKYNGLL